MFSFKFECIVFCIAFIAAVSATVFGSIIQKNINLSHEYAVTSSGQTYYIDDYTIEDGSIIFTIDGVEYHFSNYSIRKLKNSFQEVIS